MHVDVSSLFLLYMNDDVCIFYDLTSATSVGISWHICENRVFDNNTNDS